MLGRQLDAGQAILLVYWSPKGAWYVIKFEFYCNSKKQFFDRLVRRRARALLVLRARSVHPKL